MTLPGGMGWEAALAVAVVANLLSMAAYWRDKRKAARGGWRTSEKTLLCWALIAPFGAIAGMRLFRHKTRKLKFKLAYAFAALHLALAAYLLFAQ